MSEARVAIRSSSYFPDDALYRGHRGLWQRIHLDAPLLVALLALCGFGLMVLFSASDQDPVAIERQLIRLGIAFGLMIAVAQIPPARLRSWSPLLYGVGVAMLIAVLLFGDIGKGAQRWLDLGVVRFQPSELLKLAVPMMIAWLLSARALPPKLLWVVLSAVLTLIPVVLIAKQPDLGTALLVASAGVVALFMAGMGWGMILALAVVVAAVTPLVWIGLHDYQRDRVLTFLNPESDPLGSGYHIIQSKIAIGSGGIDGKGWLNGTQSHLEFLPERNTDFIFAVIGEEFGFTGILALLALYLFIILRGLVIAARAQDRFGRLLAGALTLVFFVYVFVNTGMVTGLLPVVGVPLPLISYGGTSMVTLMVGFGIIMGIQTHRIRSRG
ncbi:MAG: rod shape-determining protein RodA [Thiocapsa sp.]|nr:rod shape-determining protein RodA [Thiocapsa sp.]QVL47300.1 MAG: rod shape-determining protein RodA [Thiocapsa sp.]